MTADMDRAATESVLAEVMAERVRQHAKWGTQRHDFTVWMTVLMEEVGEAAQALLELRSTSDWEAVKRIRLDHLREELIQVAAVAVAIVEHVDEVPVPNIDRAAQRTTLTGGRHAALP